MEVRSNYALSNKNRRGLLGGNRMNVLKDLRINGLKGLKGIGLKNLGINGLKDMILKPRHIRDTDMEDLTKSREAVKRKIKELVREKKEIESRIVKFQKAGEGKNKEVPGSSWQERKRAEKIDKLELKETVRDEKLDRIRIKAEVVEVKPENKIAVSEGNEVPELNNSARKKVEEIVSPKEGENIKTANPILQEKREDKTPERSKTGSRETMSGIFGSSLIEELLESENLYPEEEQGFIKYIEESSVTELVIDLREVKKLLA